MSQYSPILSISATVNLHSMTARHKLEESMTIIPETQKTKFGILDASKAISDYLKKHHKTLFKGRSNCFNDDAFNTLKLYEDIYAPLEKDGRKAISYEKVRVQGGLYNDHAFMLLDSKQDAVLKIKEVHEFIDNKIIDTDNQSRFSNSEMAYSQSFKLVCEGFWHNHSCDEILRRIGVAGRRAINQIEGDKERGAFMVAVTAWGLTKYFDGGKKYMTGKRRGDFIDGRNQSKNVYIGDMNYNEQYSEEILDANQSFADSALERNKARIERFKNG